MRKLTRDQIERPTRSDLELLDRYPIRLLADNIRSAYNVGSLLRTADAFRLDYVYLTGITPSGDHRRVKKTALGAEHSVPWEHRADALSVVDELRANGFTIAALEITDSPTMIDEVDDVPYPICLIVGNEVQGVSDGLIDRSNIALEIPQFGAKQSLNVSVAFGIASYVLVSGYRRHAGWRRSDDVSEPPS